MRTFTAPPRQVASEGTLLRSAWERLPDRPLTEAELHRKLRAMRRLTTNSHVGVEGFVSRLVNAGALIRLPDDCYQRAGLPPEPDTLERTVETRSSLA